MTREELEGVCTEIGAGMVLRPQNEADDAWNAACARAIRIVRAYQEGRGLFQAGPASASK